LLRRDVYFKQSGQNVVIVIVLLLLFIKQTIQPCSVPFGTTRFNVIVKTKRISYKITAMKIYVVSLWRCVYLLDTQFCCRITVNGR